MARYVVAGLGAVGARAARQVHSLGGAEEIWVVGSDAARARDIVSAIGEPCRAGSWADALATGPTAVILSGAPALLDPAASLAARAREALEAGAHVVSCADGIESAEALLELDGTARAAGRHVVVGAGFSPGLSCVLAVHAAGWLGEVSEVRVACVGAAGRACARAEARSLTGIATEWEDGAWTRHPAGSGRELCWFPDPVGGRDCYRAESAGPLLLQPAFSSASRISSRRAANRRQRMGLRMPSRPGRFPEGGAGAVRVEVAGQRDGSVVTAVLGAYDRPGVAAGAVSALAAHWAAEDLLARTGAGGLAEMVKDTVGFLGQLAERGVKAAVFTGVTG